MSSNLLTFSRYFSFWRLAFSISFSMERRAFLLPSDSSSMLDEADEATKRGEKGAARPTVGACNANATLAFTFTFETAVPTAADPREETPNPETATRGRVARATRLRFPVMFSLRFGCCWCLGRERQRMDTN